MKGFRVSCVTTRWTCCPSTIRVSHIPSLEVDVAAPGNTDEAEAFATANGLTYFEASAKDHESVEAVLRHTLHLGLVRAFLVVVFMLTSNPGRICRLLFEHFRKWALT